MDPLYGKWSRERLNRDSWIRYSVDRMYRSNNLVVMLVASCYLPCPAVPWKFDRRFGSNLESTLHGLNLDS